MRLLRQSTEGSTKRGQVLLGKPVRQHSFRQLLGIGGRKFARLKRAVVLDQPAPVDGRCRPRANDGSNKVSERKRSLICEFLEETYQIMSEPMPEASIESSREVEYTKLPKLFRFRRNRGKRPGKGYRGVSLAAKAASTPATRSEQPIRLLPPGTYTEYLRIFQHKHPTVKVSLRLFCRVTCQSSAQTFRGRFLSSTPLLGQEYHSMLSRQVERPQRARVRILMRALCGLSTFVG